MFVPLHELWKKYMEDLLQIDQGRWVGHMGDAHTHVHMASPLSPGR